MRLVVAFIALCLSFFSAQAAVSVHVNKNSQSMSVVVDGVPTHHWRVSTGAIGHGTPNGVYRPYRMHKHYVSKKYKSAMPYSIFYRGGYAIHGTGAVGRLGSPASKGCVRLHPSNAAQLFALVQEHGPRSTRIVISGAGGGKKFYKKKKKRIRYASL